MEITQLLKEFQDTLDADSQRTKKPRKTGITMVIVTDVVNFGPKFIEPFQELVDRVKILDTLWHHDMSVVEKSIIAFRQMDMNVAMGGTQYEVAKAQGKIKEYIELLKNIGINEVEVENHASALTIQEMKDEVKKFKDEGFEVIGEVGKKWWWRDPTRASRDLISVEKTLEQALGLIEAGADYIYWEGMVLRGLIGTQLENKKGQKQLIEVATQVDPQKLVFEMWDCRFYPNNPLIAWLVKEFGPNVNLANIKPWDVKHVEWIRHGIFYEMDHPYMRWSQDRSAATNWWKIDAPDYDIDLQRGYVLKDFF
ncbi:MAG: phosphosulfolactate synthase [Deltaproteobacteria bacterium]|nr:MAG: phosphosulfolactate synthase [Deltaproteobacteria bacterium]